MPCRICRMSESVSHKHSNVGEQYGASGIPSPLSEPTICSTEENRRQALSCSLVDCTNRSFISTSVGTHLFLAIADESSIFALGLLKDSTQALLEDAPSSLAEVLPDTVVYWEPFPLIRQPFSFRINLLMRERCRLVQFIAELRAPIDTSQSRGQMLASAQSLARRMHHWYETLSDDLQYRTFIPAPLMEFQYDVFNTQTNCHR